MSFRGSIPEAVIAVCQPESEYTRLYTGEKVKCRPTWVTDANSEKMLVRATNWGRGKGRWHDAKLGEPDTFEHDNAPITILYLVGISKRSEGGLAYKVVTPRGYLVDFREDEFLEAVFENRMSAKGKIRGKYVWSVASGQMRLVRVGSKLYEQRKAAMKTSAKNKKIKAIPIRKLVVGNAYESKGGEIKVFIGRCLRLDKLNKTKKHFGWRTMGWHAGEFPLKAKDVYNLVTITQSSTVVKDRGPVEGTVERDAVGIRYFDGHDCGIPKSKVEWLDA